LSNPPKIFAVNWFRTDEEGKFIWPGFGENIRVLKWIIDRANNAAGAKETPIGLVPHIKDLDLSGLHIQKEKLEKLFEVNIADWADEFKEIKDFLGQFGNRLPAEMWDEYKRIS